MPLRISYPGVSYEMEWVCCDCGYPALDCIENGGRVDFRFMDDYIFGDEDNIHPVTSLIVNNNTKNLVGLKITYYYLLWGENYWFCKTAKSPIIYTTSTAYAEYCFWQMIYLISDQKYEIKRRVLYLLLCSLYYL